MEWKKIKKINKNEIMTIFSHNGIELGFNLLAFSHSGYEREKINEGLKNIENIFFNNSYEQWDENDIIREIMNLEKNHFIIFFSIGKIFQNREEIKKAIDKEFYSF